MRCKEFDAHMDGMLSGVLQPEADEHMRQCERCTSYYRARAAVHNGLRALAAEPAAPSHATDRAVMDSYRRLQERRAATRTQPPDSAPRPAARLFTFPSRGAAARGSRHRWSGLAVAAMLLATVGSGIRLWNGVSTVSSPAVAPAPAVAASTPATPEPVAEAAAATKNTTGVATAGLRRPSLHPARLGRVPTLASRPAASADGGGQLIEAKAEIAGPAAANGAENGTAEQREGNSILHLAGAGGNSAGQAAGATWPGYSNLMVCDPVVCSGPMQVVHIKVPAEQVKPGAGKSEGKSFVNADVVVGPDGVARAIRVAN